jgi:protein-S-isoprenylcysteine O-methyltransferase Ste14
MRSMALYQELYKITTGPIRAKRMLTRVGLVAFFVFLAVVILAGLLLDRWLGLPRLLPRAPGLIVGIPLILIGAFFAGWSILVFLGEEGTPVPFNPPPELVVRGPYAHSRNPMMAGLFLELFGLGILVGSIGLTLIVMPLLVAASIVALKLVEEPELDKRLGQAYIDYRRRTPMFFPRR